MSKSDEQVARETCERLVVYDRGHVLVLEFLIHATFEGTPEGLATLKRFRDRAMPIVLDALRASRAAAMLPSPVSEERLELIRWEWRMKEAGPRPNQIPTQNGAKDIDDLLAHIDHLERMLSVLTCEPEGESLAELLAQAKRDGAREAMSAGCGFSEWVCVFPGKMGMVWKRANDFVGTRPEAEKIASENCNVVAVPLELWKHVERFLFR